MDLGWPVAGLFEVVGTFLGGELVEQLFAKLKHLLRQAARRTSEAIYLAIGKLLDQFTAQECANYFKKAGYGPT